MSKQQINAAITAAKKDKDRDAVRLLKTVKKADAEHSRGIQRRDIPAAGRAREEYLRATRRLGFDPQS